MIKMIIKSLTTAIILLAIIAFAINSSLSINDYQECNFDQPDFSKCAQADAVVVVSGGDTTARTKHGVKLFKKEIGQYAIVMSGAAKDKKSVSNAEQMKQIALKMKVESNRILIEEESEDTHQNAVKVAQLLKQNDLQSIVLVTSGYHQKRAYLEFRKQLGKEFKIYNAPVPKDADWSNKWFLTSRGWELGLKEWVASSLVAK